MDKMSAVDPGSDGKLELNDSGCVQDECPAKENPQMASPHQPHMLENGYTGQAQLLDLSDDVLLYILRYCSPHDLKALGFTCARLGALVLERSLWVTVDARDVSTSRARMRWLLGALHEGTRDLLLAGYAEQARGCRGHVNRTRKEVEDENSKHNERRDEFLCGRRGIDFDGRYYAAQSTIREVDAPVEIENLNGPGAPEPPFPLVRQHARLHINAQQLPRQSSSPSWPEDCEWDDPEGEQIQEESSEDTAGCPGPVFTLSAQMIKEIRTRCPKLTSLSLQHCNINCNKISPSIFPPSLKRLSLRGTRCYNPPLDKSYLFRIHDYLPDLEYLDLSECAWLEPAALLPLSKLVRLRVLLMRECPAMAEFVAYVSLATRYGFRALKVLDLRGSPVGDSEVSALGWLPELHELYLEAPKSPEAPPSPLPHHHYIGDPLPRHPHLDQWELQIPEYYKARSWSESESAESSMEDVEGQVEMLRETYDHPTAPFSIELHTRVIQAAPRAHRAYRDEPQEDDDNEQQIHLRAELNEALARMNRPAQRNEGGAQRNEGGAQRNEGGAQRNEGGAQMNEEREEGETQRNEKEAAQRIDAHINTINEGARRRAADNLSGEEPGPSKRNKPLNGECSKADDINETHVNDSAENSKSVYKYKIFKYKNDTNSDAAGASHDDNKDNNPPENTIPNTNNNENTTIKPGPSNDKQNKPESLLPKNANNDSTNVQPGANKETNERSGDSNNENKPLQSETGTKRYEYNLGDVSNSQNDEEDSINPDDSPSRPKQPSNSQDEYKTCKNEIQVQVRAGLGKESKRKSNDESKTTEKVSESDEERESLESKKDNSQSEPKYKVDVNVGASTSRYSIRDRLNTDGEPSAKRPRRNTNEISKTEKPSIESNTHQEVEMSSGARPKEKDKRQQLEDERLKPDEPAAEVQALLYVNGPEEENRPENKPKQKARREEDAAENETPPWVRPQGERLDDAPEQGVRVQEREETDAAQEEKLENEPKQVETPQEERREPQEARLEGEEEDEPERRGREMRVQPNLPPQFVRFRRHQEPVIIQCPVFRNEQPGQPAQQPAQPANQPAAAAENPVAEPRHHVLYVNLGQQLHAVYRLLPNRPFQPTRPRPPPAEHLDNSSLVSDASIRRFGRADGEDVNIVHIGPNGPQFGGRDTSGRPNRSNLRILSATGYRHITNRSLIHLATAAPHLQRVDFSSTSVTIDGVESFKSLRPEVEVKFSAFKDEDNEE